MKKFKGRDIISIDDFSQEELLYIFNLAGKFEKKVNSNLLKGNIAAMLFYEASTRTEQSFRSAAQRIGAGVIGFNDVSVTSIKKGESFTDTLKIIANYSDVIVIRHPQAGSAKIAAEAVNIPVINGGDGPNHHPTQTMLDIYTILKVFKRLNNLKIALVGDPKHYRSMHGLVLGMSKFPNNQLFGVSPAALKIQPEFRGQNYQDVVTDMRNLDQTLEKLAPDIVYAGRIPKEYIKGKSQSYNFRITAQTIKILPKSCVIMHPLPRVNEIDPEVDKFPNAIYFTQAKNGLYIREAILALVLGKI